MKVELEFTGETLSVLREISASLKSLVYGGDGGPTGLEALTMAIAGEGKPGRENNIARSLIDIEEHLGVIASELNDEDGAAQSIRQSLASINQQMPG